MSFKQPRDWTTTMVSRGHDTNPMAAKGRGNPGTFVFSVPRRLGDPFIQKYGNGHDYVHVRINKKGDDLILYPIKPGERGRKFSLSSDRKDYRAFFDPGNYEWINQIEPFAATEAKASLVEGGLLVTLPPLAERVPHIPYTQYKPRTPTVVVKKRVMPVFDPAPPAAPAVSRDSSPPPAVPGSNGEGTLYLVMVPAEKEDKFQLMMKFLKLEALKE